MKKLISILLVLTMALSLMGGLGVSAMASGELPEAAQDETTDASVPPAEGEQTDEDGGGSDADVPGDDSNISDETDGNDAGEADETGASDEADGEIIEPVEGEMEPVEAEPAAAGPEWKKANGFVAGQSYVIVVDGKAVANNNGTLTTSDTTDGSDASTVWAASDGAKLTNSGVNLYYDKANLVLSTTADSKANWKYSDGTLLYQAGGDTYSISGVSGANVTIVKNGTGCTVTLYTSGSDLGSTGGGSGSGDSGSGGDSVTYGKVTDLSKPYIAIVDTANNQILCSDMGLAASSVTAGETVSPSKGTSAKVTAVGAAYTLQMQDPPESWNYLYVEDGTLKMTGKDATGLVPADYAHWNVDSDGNLYYDLSGTKYYFSALPTTMSTTPNTSIELYGGDSAASGGGGKPGGGESDASAPVIVTYPKAVPYVKEGSGYAAPTYSIQAKLADGVASRSIYFQWFVGDVAVSEKTKISIDSLTDGIASSTVTIDALRDMPVGVYTVSCQVTCNTDGGRTPHTTTANVSFAVCKGVLENSFLTFSDVHETFQNVGMAIYDTIIQKDGYIPSLIICTGDWANGHLMGGDKTSDNYKSTMNDYIALLKAQAAGIDTIFISGNHDNGQAAADATIEAGLGAAADYDGVGIAYDSRNAPKANSSKNNDDLVVFAINYDALEVNSGYSYENVIPKLRAALEKLDADGFTGKFVVSAHAGLHVLGVQDGSGATDWGGNGEYNVDKSDEMVALLNQYGDKMDIMFLFGHDHSKGESELFLEPGNTITSTTAYADKTTQAQEIKFSYGHAGYITNTIGGQEKFTLVTWDNDGFHRAFNTVEQKTAPAVSSNSGSNGGKGSKAPGKTAPKTGDDSNIVLWASLFFLCAGTAVVVATRKKEHN